MSDEIVPAPAQPKITALVVAVVEAINAKAIPNCPAALRVQATRFELATTAGLLVDVIAGEGREFTRVSRGTWGDAPAVDVFLYRKAKPGYGASNAGDEVAGIGEQIVNAFLDGRFAGYRLVQPTIEAFDRDWAVEYGVVGYVINLKFSDP